MTLDVLNKGTADQILGWRIRNHWRKKFFILHILKEKSFYFESVKNGIC